MKQNTLTVFLILSLFFSGCKSKTKNEDEKKEGFFPVLSFLKSQVAHVDTSLYQITKITTIDNEWDTLFIKREEFREYARDFLDLPDLADKKYAADYEETKFFDASLNRVIMSYSPKDKSATVQKEEVTIEPGAGEADKVKNIIVDKLLSGKDSSTVTKRLLWTVGTGFQVTTITQRPGKADSTETTKITWE